MDWGIDLVYKRKSACLITICYENVAMRDSTPGSDCLILGKDPLGALKSYHNDRAKRSQVWFLGLSLSHPHAFHLHILQQPSKSPCLQWLCSHVDHSELGFISSLDRQDNHLTTI